MSAREISQTLTLTHKSEKQSRLAAVRALAFGCHKQTGKEQKRRDGCFKVKMDDAKLILEVEKYSKLYVPTSFSTRKIFCSFLNVIYRQLVDWLT